MCFVVQTGLNGHGWLTSLWPVGALLFLALSNCMRPCVERKVPHKQAPARGLCVCVCDGGRSGLSGIYSCFHGGGCSERSHCTLVTDEH